MAKYDWTDEEREVIIGMRTISITATRTFYDSVLDGNEESVEIFKQMLDRVVTNGGEDSEVEDDLQENFKELLDKLIDGDK